MKALILCLFLSNCACVPDMAILAAGHVVMGNEIDAILDPAFEGMTCGSR